MIQSLTEFSSCLLLQKPDCLAERDDQGSSGNEPTKTPIAPRRAALSGDKSSPRTTLRRIEPFSADI